MKVWRNYRKVVSINTQKQLEIMSSIKLEVLSQIAKRKQCSRQDVQKFIWVAQGNDIKDYE